LNIRYISRHQVSFDDVVRVVSPLSLSRSRFALRTLR
jgi:hypothetical protein